MQPSKVNKNVWCLILVMLAGLAVGGFVGQLIENLAGSVDFLSFLKVLSYNQSFGITQPVVIDIGVLSFSLGFMINFNIWRILGMIVAIIIYRRM